MAAPDRTPHLDRAAVASLWAGTMGLGPPALVLGVIARRRMRRTGGSAQERALTRAGLVFGVIYTLILAVVVVLVLV